MDDDKELLERAERAGEVAQALFYTFIEHTWAYDMNSVNIIPGSNGKLLSIEVFHGSQTAPTVHSVCKRIAGGWLFNFPHGAFGSADRKAKHSLLADRHSVWAFVFMHIAVQVLFEDLVDQVERDVKEIAHYLPRHVGRIVKHRASDRFLTRDRDDLPYPDEDASGALKAVYRITLRNGTKIALDLAGAQYSPVHNTVTRWTEYFDHWITHVKYRLPFRSHYNKHGDRMSSLQFQTHLNIITEQMACFNGLLQNCESELGFDIKDLAAENTGYSRNCKHRLIVAAKDRLLQRPRDLDAELAIISKNVAKDPMVDELECIPGNIGDMKYFDWSKLSKMIAMPGDKVSYKEKKRARLLQKFCCAYKMPGDWGLVFVEDSLPRVWVPRECVSENPSHGRKKK